MFFFKVIITGYALELNNLIQKVSFVLLSGVLSFTPAVLSQTEIADKTWLYSSLILNSIVVLILLKSFLALLKRILLNYQFFTI